MASAAAPTTPTSLLGNGRRLIVNKATPVGTIDDEDDPSVKFLQAASIVPENTYAAGIRAHYFVFGEEPRFSDGQPLRAVFKEADDAVIFMFKQSGMVTYLYGMTIPKLIEWNAPRAPGEAVDEAGLLTTWKITHSDLLELVPLENTETHRNLRDLAEKMMSHLPSLLIHKVRNFKDAQVWCTAGFRTNIKKVVFLSEAAARKKAAEKSSHARDGTYAESIQGGLDAKALWAKRQECLLAMEPYYKPYSFEGRFITIDLDAVTKKPTAATIDEIRGTLAKDPFSSALLPAFEVALADFIDVASERFMDEDKQVLMGSPLAPYLAARAPEGAAGGEGAPAPASGAGEGRASRKRSAEKAAAAAPPPKVPAPDKEAAPPAEAATPAEAAAPAAARARKNRSGSRRPKDKDKSTVPAPDKAGKEGANPQPPGALVQLVTSLRAQITDKDKEITRLTTALAEATKKAEESVRVQKLEIKCAVMEAKMKCGGKMLAHLEGGGSARSAHTAAASASTPGSSIGSAPTPAALPSLSAFFDE